MEICVFQRILFMLLQYVVEDLLLDEEMSLTPNIS